MKNKIWIYNGFVNNKSNNTLILLASSERQAKRIIKNELDDMPLKDDRFILDSQSIEKSGFVYRILNECLEESK